MVNEQIFDSKGLGFYSEFHTMNQVNESLIKIGRHINPTPSHAEVNQTFVHQPQCSEEEIHHTLMCLRSS